jgi:hypothetical protein
MYTVTQASHCTRSRTTTERQREEVDVEYSTPGMIILGANRSVATSAMNQYITTV